MNQSLLKSHGIALSVALLAGIFTASPSYGKGGDGARGNGQVIVDAESGDLRLRDFTDANVCEFKSPEMIFAGNEYHTQFHKNLDNLNWYVGHEIKNEENYLFYCFLPKLPEMGSKPDENESLLFKRLRTDKTFYANVKNALQLGYREGRYVYFFQDRFDAIKLTELKDRTGKPLSASAGNKELIEFYTQQPGEGYEEFEIRKRKVAQLLAVLHEISHSYFDRFQVDRTTHLYSFVTMLRKVALGAIYQPSQLAYQINATRADLKFDTQKFDGFKETIKFLFSGQFNDKNVYGPSEAQRQAIIGKSFRQESQGDLYEISTAVIQDIIESLNPWDVKVLSTQTEGDAKKIYAEALQSTLSFLSKDRSYENEFEKVVAAIPNDKYVRNHLNRNITYFPKNREQILAAPGMQESNKRAYSNLGNLGVKWGKYSIVGQYGLSRLFLGNALPERIEDEQAILNLPEVAYLPMNLIPIANGMIALLHADPDSRKEEENYSILKAQYFANADFKALFNLSDAKAQVFSLPAGKSPQVDRPGNREAILTHLKDLSLSLKNALVRYLKDSGKVSDQKLDQVKTALLEN